MKCPKCSSLIIHNRRTSYHVPGAPITCPHCGCTMRVDRRGTITIIQTRPNVLPQLNNVPKSNISNNENNNINEQSAPVVGESEYFALPATYKFAAAKKLGKTDTQFLKEQYLQERNAEIIRLASEMKAQAQSTPLFENGPIKENRTNNVNLDAILAARDAEISQVEQTVQPVNPKSFIIQETNNSAISDQEIQRMNMVRNQQNQQFLNQQKRGTDAVKLNSNLSYYDPNANHYYQVGN